MVIESICLGYGSDLGDVLAEGGGQREADELIGMGTGFACGVHFHLVDLLVAGQETVVGVFIDYPEADEEGYGHAGAEADDVEGAVNFIVDEVTPGGFKEALYHTNGGRKNMPEFEGIE